MDSKLPVWSIKGCDERSMSANQGTAANRHHTRPSGDLGNLSATFAADGTFPAAVAGVDRHWQELNRPCVCRQDALNCQQEYLFRNTLRLILRFESSRNCPINDVTAAMAKRGTISSSSLRSSDGCGREMRKK